MPNVHPGYVDFISTDYAACAKRSWSLLFILLFPLPQCPDLNLSRRPVAGFPPPLGTAICLQGETEKAIVAYSRAADLAPTLAAPRVNLGAQLLRSGRLAEAEAVSSHVRT